MATTNVPLSEHLHAIATIHAECTYLGVMKEHRFYVYIMASLSGTLYAGVTNNVRERVQQHKSGEVSEFTCKYKVDRLVYYERFQYVGNAIAREKQIKGWRRSKKVALIESVNPSWRDLSRDFGKEFQPERPRSDRGPSPAARDDNSDEARDDNS